jgi:hypothetical protein
MAGLSGRGRGAGQEMTATAALPVEEEEKAKELERRIRRKFKTSFEYYSPRCLKIRSKSGKPIAFTMNKSQMYLHMSAEKQLKTLGRIRVLVLKGRQQGMCLSPDTLVMRNDFTCSQIRDIKIGDKLIGIDEGLGELNKANRRKERRMRTATVEAVRTFKRELFEVELSDGRIVKCTSEHRWAMRQRSGDYVQWRNLGDAKIGDFIRAATHSLDEGTETFEDGWIAGVLDADGSCSVTRAPRVAFSQLDGLVLNRYKKYLNNINVKWYENIDRRTKVGRTTKLGDRPVHAVRVDKLPDIMRLLGKAKTTRFNLNHIYEGRKLPRSSNGFDAWIKITSIKSLGISDVVDIQTDCKTFIANGLVSHNSTYVEGRFYWKVTQGKGKQAYILTHEEPATQNLFKMVERYHDNCLPKLKPITGMNSAKELNFASIDSGYKVGTAGSKGTGRSSTIQYFHGSEVAFWPHADTHAAGVIQGVPMEPDTEIFLESTANGIGNYFHHQWQMAESGESEYIAVFLPWYWQDEYKVLISKEFRPTIEELELLKHFGPDGLTMEHIAWRRIKTVELSVPGEEGDWKFKQEYPFTAQEAFQTSGDDVLINPKNVLKARKSEVACYGAHVVGVDPARFGVDRTGIIHREGRKAYGIQTLKKKGTMEVAGICARILKHPITGKNTNVDMMFIDVGGLGAGVYDRLEELGFEDEGRITAVNSAEKPLEEEQYMNKRAEMWGEMREWFSMRVDVVDSDELHADVCGPKYKYDSASRLVIEKKEDMMKRGLRSPDIGDALALTFAFPVAPKRKLHGQGSNDFAPVDTMVGY